MRALRTVAYLSTLLMFCGCSDDPTPKIITSENPRDISLITSDIDLFWKTYDDQNPNFNSVIFRDKYFESGTEALSLFFSQKIKDASKLVGLLESNRHYYESIRSGTLNIDNNAELYYQSFETFKNLYPEAIFTDIVFAIGALGTGGTVVQNGQMVIGVELFSKSASSDISNFSEWLKNVIRNDEYLPTIAIHELVHVQQLYFRHTSGTTQDNNQTLLETASGEGIADFITYLVLDGLYLNDHLPEYADNLEEELWNEFKLEMDGADLSNWLFNGGQSPDRPADLGYYMGFKIAESFYDKAADKSEAVKIIIQVTDFKNFLEASGYEEKFN